MNELERQVTALLLAGDHPALETLRRQLPGARVSGREETSAGFFTEFEVPPDLPRFEERGSFTLSDVFADVRSLEHGAGFILFVRGGAIDCLEGYIFDREWPRPPKLIRAYYTRPATGGRGRIVETAERDLAWALRDLDAGGPGGPEES